MDGSEFRVLVCGGRGTADMISQGKKAGVPVYEVK